MKKIISILSVFAVFSANVSAASLNTLDVFEEYAVADAVPLTENFSLKTEQNKKITSTLKYTSDTASVSFETVTPPSNGILEITDCKGNFSYTPNKDYIGDDLFRFRISENGENSNISTCTISVTEKTDIDNISFIYEDMQTHWASYPAVKLTERDVLKGERIGKRYYFYPNTKMRRIDVVEYMLAALNADFNDVNKNETHIFEDSTDSPEYINNAGYLANKYGFLSGTRNGAKIYFYPYKYINRAEFIYMIDSAMKGKTQNGDEIKFADNGNIPDWAAQSVKNLVGYGIVKGFEDNTLRPYDGITKAQAAEMLWQMIKYNDNNPQTALSARIKHELYGNYMI